MKKAMITILLAIPFLMIFLISISARIITTYQDIELLDFYYIDSTNKIISVNDADENEDDVIQTITLSIGEEKQLYLVYFPTKTTQKEVRIVNNNEEVCSFENGTIKGLTTGISKITVKSYAHDDLQASFYVQVVQINPIDIYVEQSDIEIKVNQTTQINALALPYNVINNQLYYETKDANIATVSKSGLVTAISEGSTTIYVKSFDQMVVKEIKVNITGVEVMIWKIIEGEGSLITGSMSYSLNDYLNTYIDSTQVVYDIINGSSNGSINNGILNFNESNKIITVSATYEGITQTIKFRSN